MYVCTSLYTHTLAFKGFIIDYLKTKNRHYIGWGRFELELLVVLQLWSHVYGFVSMPSKFTYKNFFTHE